ncbi:RNA polymerase sigma factor [Pedobacter jamesrossensis]|uniref:RNA polymerase sigma factor n=1 Tax=Pedobacter jamesrossensis TaxID=1908238 RepID=A0ABV8NII0_9SPHI
MPSLNTYSDSELVLLVKNGNGTAFKEIYERYWTILFLHGSRVLGDEEDAKDIVQELFVQLWNKADELNFGHSLSAYLFTATKNRILNHLAHRKVKSDYEESLRNFVQEGELITEEHLREKELALIIEREISLLPPRMREVFELSRKEFLSYKEIAESLNISEHTVRRQVSNALSILRSRMGLPTIVIYMLLSNHKS